MGRFIGNNMKRIKTFKLFEGVMVTNNHYIELKEILQSKLFDEFNILPEDDFSDFQEFDVYPEHKFWSYLTTPERFDVPDHFMGIMAAVGTNKWTCNSNTRNLISSISIFNINDNEFNDFNDVLESIKPLIEDSIGVEMEYTYERVDVYFDYTIRLGSFSSK